MDTPINRHRESQRERARARERERATVTGFTVMRECGTPRDPVPDGTRDKVEDECTGPCRRRLGALVGVEEVGSNMVCCLALCHSLVPAPVKHAHARAHTKPGSSSSGLTSASATEQGLGEEWQGGAVAKYIGDPLEIATFDATGASLEVGAGGRACACTPGWLVQVQSFDAV